MITVGNPSSYSAIDDVSLPMLACDGFTWNQSPKAKCLLREARQRVHSELCTDVCHSGGGAEGALVSLVK